MLMVITGKILLGILSLLYYVVLLITLFFKQIEIKDIIQYEEETIIRSIGSASYQTFIGKDFIVK